MKCKVKEYNIIKVYQYDNLYNLYQLYNDYPESSCIWKRKENYLERQKKAGFKQGDFVKITCAATSDSNGWYNTWTESMNNTIGHYGKIISNPDTDIESGILIKVGLDKYIYRYPYFVLEKA